MTQETPTPETELEQTVTVAKGSFNDEHGYWIVRGCQTAFFQRKDIFRATDRPLSAVERDTIALCETVLHLERRLQEAERLLAANEGRVKHIVDEQLLARAEAMAGLLEDAREIIRCEIYDSTAAKELLIKIDAALSHPLGGKT